MGEAVTPMPATFMWHQNGNLRAAHGQLFLGGFIAADPNCERLHEAMRLAHWTPTPEDDITLPRWVVDALLAATRTWIHYGAHPAPDKDIAAQLVKVRRRARLVERERQKGRKP